MKKVVFTVVLLLLAAICCANESNPDFTKGEGDWGTNNTPLVRVYDVNSHYKRDTAVVGSLRNVSSAPVKNLIVTVGRHGKGNTLDTIGNDVLPINLAPQDVWRWSVPTQTTKKQGYQVLGISVDSQVLDHLSPPGKTN